MCRPREKQTIASAHSFSASEKEFSFSRRSVWHWLCPWNASDRSNHQQWRSTDSGQRILLIMNGPFCWRSNSSDIWMMAFMQLILWPVRPMWINHWDFLLFNGLERNGRTFGDFVQATNRLMSPDKLKGRSFCTADVHSEISCAFKWLRWRKV